MKSATDKRYDCNEVAFDRTLDACKITEAVLNNFMIGWLFRELESHLNFPLKYPFGPGQMELKNATIKLPEAGHLNLFKGYYCFNILVIAKTQKMRTTENVFEVSGRGKIELH